MQAIAAAPILAAPSPKAETLAMLDPGDVFDVLEMTSAYCWGQGRTDKLVGYVASDLLERPSSTGEQAA